MVVGFVQQSAFADATKNCNGIIYGIYHNPNRDGKFGFENCMYVGKSLQEMEGDRFIQHVTSPSDKDYPWFYEKDWDNKDYNPINILFGRLTSTSDRSWICSNPI